MNKQESRFNIMRPHIEVKPLPINNNNDDIENDSDTHCLYHVIVSQGKLKMLFLVSQIPREKIEKREFEVVRCEYISLHGMSERDKYLGVIDNISISADITIVSEIFDWTLKPYGLQMLEVVFHNFEFFESEVEGKGFIFKDKDIYEELKDRINSVCIKMLKNPYIIEY